MQIWIALLFVYTLTPAHAFFTENSIRRDASKFRETGSVVRFARCTGFFIANTDNRLFVATARHCLDTPPSSWCSKGVDSNHIFYSFDFSSSATCKRVIIDDNNRDDFVVFEVNIFRDSDNKEIKLKTYPLRLANFRPEPGARLSLNGFPRDSERAGSATSTISENCWDNSGQSFPYFNVDLTTPKTGTDVFTFGRYSDPLQNKYSTERVGWHNCSVFAGNSGGPLTIEDSDIVVGLPEMYSTKKMIYPSNAAAAYILTATFINHRLNEFVSNGINIESVSILKPSEF